MTNALTGEHPTLESASPPHGTARLEQGLTLIAAWVGVAQLGLEEQHVVTPDRPADLAIYNLQGELVLERRLPAEAERVNEFTVDLDVASGLYLARLTSEKAAGRVDRTSTEAPWSIATRESWLPSSASSSGAASISTIRRASPRSWRAAPRRWVSICAGRPWSAASPEAGWPPTTAFSRDAGWWAPTA